MSKEFRNSSHPLAKKIPILAMTANAFSEDVQNAFNAGMNAHIVKPVDMKVLIKTVRNLQTGAVRSMPKAMEFSRVVLPSASLTVTARL